MAESAGSDAADRGLPSHNWRLSYKTSATMIDGRPVDMLHDFYVPVLSLAIRYDRVAGYFRSSSLAAASQGFSAFVGRQGRMRLIVGADLEPEDVRAVLAGDSERLAARLNGELAEPAAWPQGVRNGVSLLAWMVAKGYLEVRVAFRIHGVSGEPLYMDAVDDGYVHEKWFVLGDEFGSRLYGSGTLNESKTALVLNAENIEVHCDWWGDTDCRRVDEAAEAFEHLWAGKVAHLPVLPLPEAVHRNLVKLSEGINYPFEVDGSSAAQKPAPAPSALERLRFSLLRDAPKLPGGRFVGAATAPVEPWPHQAMVVRKLIETWPYSYLLCDEVGLGKTIEAGLAFRSLYLSGLAKRILIAAPASLTQQWQRQMASKMLLSFGRVRNAAENCHEYIFPEAETRAAESIYEPDLIIMSTGLLARQERAAGLLGAKQFDIALVDEAHAARRRNPAQGQRAYPDFGNLYLSIRDFLRKRTSCLWLATATPMQIHPVEVCDLLALTNRVGAFQFDPTLTLQYYEVLGQLVHSQEPKAYEWEYVRRAVQAIEVQDPLLWEFLKGVVIDGRIRTAVTKWLDYGMSPKGRDRELIKRFLFSSSPLARVMQRHTRGLLEVYREKGQLKQNLARRHLQPMPQIRFNALEQKTYAQLKEYCDGLAAQIRRHGDNQSRQMMSFLLSFLRLRFASSLYALGKTLQRRLAKVEATLRHQLIMQAEDSASASSDVFREWIFEGEDEDDLIAVESLLKNRTMADLEWEKARLRTLLNTLADITGPSSKMTELLYTLEKRRDRHTGRIEQTVIFTRFFDTLTDIVRRLQQVDPRMLIGTYSGQESTYYNPHTAKMLSVVREEVKERFLRGEIDLLVCTDAAAEGLNLQTANLLINFDLGWNPMKIEQRIGRIDRIGQKHEDIYVLNLCYTGSEEEVVYDRLLRRLADANMIVGTQQYSLLPVGPDDFCELAEGSITPEELFARADKKMEEQKQRTAGMEIHPRDLHDIYSRLSSNHAAPPVDLSSIWEALRDSRYLQDLGCVPTPDKLEGTMKLSGVIGVPDGAIITVSRELYEEGAENAVARVCFASYGDPYFEAVIAQICDFELPACIQRISVPIQGMDGVEVVGFAAACCGSGGIRELRLITGWDDLHALSLSGAEALSTAEIGPLKAQLELMAIREFEPYLAARRIEQNNLTAARVQEILNFLAVSELLSVRARPAEGGALFWPVLREIDDMFKDRERVLVNDLPADLFRPYVGEMLFDCQVPNVGTKAHVGVNPLLGRAASDSAYRVAESMKERKSGLMVDKVLARLRREVENRSRLLHYNKHRRESAADKFS